MEDQPGAIDHYTSLIYEQKGGHDEAVRHDLAALHAQHPQFDSAALLDLYKRRGWQPYWRARHQVLQTTTANSCTAYEIGLDDLRINDLHDAFTRSNALTTQGSVSWAEQQLSH